MAWAVLVRSLPDPGAQVKGRDQTSVVLDRNGKEVAKLFAEQNRTDVPLNKTPVVLRHAVIATEDKRFYEHQGVDPLAILRALIVDIRTGTRAQGGSTITQQYVKNAFITPERTVKRKVMEAALAYRIDKNMTKDQVLEAYLNTIYFGHGAYGIEAASHTYFGKSVAKLDLAESAMLAGVIKSPGRYSPYLEPEAAKTRRSTVLAQMEKEGFITSAQRSAADAKPIKLAGLKSGKIQAPYFVEYVKSLLADNVGAEALYRDGLRVYTTLDLDMQKAAEKAIASHLDRKDDPSAALVAIDPATGEIRAMVGGRDFKTQQFNVAVQGRRQPGSAFKPFVLATALKEGVFPEQVYECGPVQLTVPGSKPWKVTGAGGGRKGPMRLREATEKSVNSVYAQLILDVGPENVVEVAHDLGITNDITPVPAIALGGHEQGLSPLEMASAYATLANEGKHVVPRAVLEVKDSKGKSLATYKPQTTSALKPAVAYLATNILRGVITKGTGRAASIGRPAAGKTGTTQEYRDAWFAGYTPQLAAAVWVGYPGAQREMKSVHGRRVTGGSFPAEIWGTFMKAALKGEKSTDFKKPQGIVSKTACADTGLLATEFCPKRLSALFIEGALPEKCDVHTTPTEIKVPNLIGKTKEAALALLKKLFLQVKVVERDVAGVAAGIVADQDPKAGSIGTTQTVVTITVSTGGTQAKPPVAKFTFSPTEPRVGQNVVFDASTSTDDGKIVRYVWEFGDGGKNETSGKTATHKYAAPGTYSVTLWVTDDSGEVSSTTASITVR